MAGRSILSWLFGTKAPGAAHDGAQPVIQNDMDASGPLRIRAAGSSFTRPEGREGVAGHPADTVQVPFEFVVVPGARAEAAMATLRQMRPGTVPVILGAPREAGMAMEYFHNNDSAAPDDILTLAADLDIESWFERRYDELSAAFNAAMVEEVEDATPPRGDWPETVTPTLDIGAASRYDAADKKMVWCDEVVIALLPTDNPSAVPAHMRFGGWNDCPPPELHVAIARRWAASHGARIVVCGSDTIEMRVERPISTREEAIEMALLQYRYCSDIVDQGVGTIEDLAASLIGSTVWFFWWD